MRTFILDESNSSRIGRCLAAQDGTLWCVQSGSGAEFGFCGSKLVLTVKGGAVAFPESVNSVRMVVFVNGERAADVLLDEDMQSFVLIDSDKAVDAQIRIIKVSEAAKSVMGIVSLSADEGAVFSKTEKKQLNIEFIGDSITCGYGVDDEVIEHSFSTATEDCTKAYAYKTAQALGAEYSLFSYSGWGVVSGWTETGERSAHMLIPDYYDTVGFCEAPFSGQKMQDFPWDTESFGADIVVINLGTNDESYCGTDEARRAEFTEGYVKFLGMVRAHNPKAHIICALGIMGDAMYPCVELACRDYSEKTGDKNVSAFRFVPQDGEADGFAVDWHPTEKTNDKAAKALCQYIEQHIIV